MPATSQNLAYHTPESFRALNRQGIFDLGFIGGGVSSGATLHAILERLEASGKTRKRFEVIIIDEFGDFGQGIAYGERSGKQSLIITPVKDFLPEPLLNEFMAWTSKNLDALFSQEPLAKGRLWQDWKNKNEEKLRTGYFEDVHIPRYFFGIFFNDRLLKTINKCKQRINVFVVKDQVAKINTKKGALDEDQYVLITEGENYIPVKKVLLGIGSLSRQKINVKKGQFSRSLILQDVFHPHLETQLKLISKKFKGHAKLKVLIAGGNASALEAIYQLQGHQDLEDFTFDFTVINPQGVLPLDYKKPKVNQFVASSLEGISDDFEALTADHILAAFYKDLDQAKADSLTISETLQEFTRHVARLVRSLSVEQKQLFANYHGNEIGRLQRRCGSEYVRSWQNPKLGSSVNLYQGLVEELVPGNNGKINIQLREKIQGPQPPSDFDVAINCLGSSDFGPTNPSSLVRSLITDIGLRPTRSKKGIVVDKLFRAAPNLFVNGPLLSGNVIGDSCIWHVEHCGRIVNFASELANILHDEKDL